MRWHLSFRADPRGKRLADRHYSRQNPAAAQFVPPGSCLVLLTADADALWITSAPKPEFVKHAWAGAWVCSLFRNESALRSSDLIREAVAATCWRWGTPPPLGMVTFVDPAKVADKPVQGWCYRRAGFRRARCPKHAAKDKKCSACKGLTEAGLVALQITPGRMPPPLAPGAGQADCFAPGVLAEGGR